MMSKVVMKDIIDEVKERLKNIDQKIIDKIIENLFNIS